MVSASRELLGKVLLLFRRPRAEKDLFVLLDIVTSGCAWHGSSHLATSLEMHPGIASKAVRGARGVTPGACPVREDTLSRNSISVGCSGICSCKDSNWHVSEASGASGHWIHSPEGQGRGLSWRNMSPRCSLGKGQGCQEQSRVRWKKALERVMSLQTRGAKASCGQQKVLPACLLH